MTSMEKKLTENRLTEVKAALSAKYRTVDLGGEKFFVATDGAFFRVYAFPSQAALVIEYADTEQEARQNALEMCIRDSKAGIHFFGLGGLLRSTHPLDALFHGEGPLMAVSYTHLDVYKRQVSS